MPKAKPVLKPSRPRVREGQVFAFPLVPGSQWAFAKVLFVSRYFRNMILVGVHDALAGSPDFPDSSTKLLRPYIYTGKQAVTLGMWPVVAECSITAEEAHASLRVVAEEVWERDTFLRPATDEDVETLPHQSIGGALFFRRAAARLLAHRGAQVPES